MASSHIQYISFYYCKVKNLALFCKLTASEQTKSSDQNKQEERGDNLHKILFVTFANPLLSCCIKCSNNISISRFTRIYPILTLDIHFWC